jgi:hypothetical protein
MQIEARKVIKLGITAIFIIIIFMGSGVVSAIKSTDEDDITVFSECDIQLENVMLITQMMLRNSEPTVFETELGYKLFESVVVEKIEDRNNNLVLEGLTVFYLDNDSDGEFDPDNPDNVFVMLLLYSPVTGEPYAETYTTNLRELMDYIQYGISFRERDCGIYQVISFGDFGIEDGSDTIPPIDTTDI